MGGQINNVSDCVQSTQSKFTAAQIAKWFVDKATSETKNGGDYLTQLKLQKLLYYAKGFYYVFENEPLFADTLKAQKYGPVVQSVVSVLKTYGSNPIISEFTDVESVKDKSVLEFLNFIYTNIASVYATEKLVNLTHQEKPWRQVENGKIIDDQLICDYFRETYLSDEDANWIVSRKALLSAMTQHNMQKYQKAYRVLARC